MSLEQAYANLGAMKHRPSSDVQKELQTLVVVGYATLQVIEQMKATIDDIEARVSEIEKETRIGEI